MCKERWRPYLKPSPARFIAIYGPELGQAIIQKDIGAVSEISIRPGKWIAMIGGVLFPSPVNGIIIPASFDDPYVAKEWLLTTLPSLDLTSPTLAVEAPMRIAYSVYSLLTQETVVAELVAVTPENETQLRTKFLEEARSGWMRNQI